MNALQIADSFDLYAADHTPDGWPAVQQKQLTEAALMLRKQHEAVVKLRKVLDNLKPCTHAGSIGHYWIRQALADTEEFVK